MQPKMIGEKNMFYYYKILIAFLIFFSIISGAYLYHLLPLKKLIAKKTQEEQHILNSKKFTTPIKINNLSDFKYQSLQELTLLKQLFLSIQHTDIKILSWHLQPEENISYHLFNLTIEANVADSFYFLQLLFNFSHPMWIQQFNIKILATQKIIWTMQFKLLKNIARNKTNLLPRKTIHSTTLFCNNPLESIILDTTNQALNISIKAMYPLAFIKKALKESALLLLPTGELLVTHPGQTLGQEQAYLAEMNSKYLHFKSHSGQSFKLYF